MTTPTQKNATKKVRSEYLALSEELLDEGSRINEMIRDGETEYGMPTPYDPLLSEDRVRNKKTGEITTVLVAGRNGDIIVEDGSLVNRYDLELLL